MVLLIVDPSQCLIGQLAIVLGDLRFDEGDLVAGQSVSLVELGVCPFLVQWQIRDEGIDILRCVLGGFAERDKEANETCAQVGLA